MRYKLDPDNPNVKAAAALIGRIIWQYVSTHTAEECAELKRRSDREQAICVQLHGADQGKSA